MKIFILKPKSKKEDEQMIKGIRHVFPNAEFVDNIENCELCVTQNGYTRSNYCMKQVVKYRYKIRFMEGNLFLDWQVAHVNFK